MALKIRMAVAVTTLALSLSSLAKTPENFIYTSRGDLDAAFPLVARSDIGGVQIVYNWRLLEPEKDSYDFSRIEQIWRALRLPEKLFIQIQDRFFEPDARYVPDYLMRDTQYGGGIAPQFDNPGEGKPVIQDGWRVSGIPPCASATRHCWPPWRNALMARCMG